MEQAGGGKEEVRKVLGACDLKNNFNYLSENGIESGIKTRIGASTQSKGSPYRAKCVRERKRLGYRSWRDRHGYGMRWKTESFNSGVKHRRVRESHLCRRGPPGSCNYVLLLISA